MSLPPKHYSEEQILCGLREVWESVTGAYDTPFAASTRIDAYLKVDGTWDKFDPADATWPLERFFGIRIEEADWRTFWRYDVSQRSVDEWERTIAPQLTFGTLTRFIADRTTAVSLEPVSILGSPCTAAGVFLGIQDVAEGMLRKRQRVAPTSRLLDVMRGETLDKYWARLRWITEDRLPPLPASWREVTYNATMLGFTAMILGFATTVFLESFTGIIVAAAIAVGAYFCAALYKYLANPLPENVQTFRDLTAMIVAFGEK